MDIIAVKEERKYTLIEDLICIKLRNQKETIPDISDQLRNLGFDRTVYSVQKRCRRLTKVSSFDTLYPGICQDEVDRVTDEASKLLEDA